MSMPTKNASRSQGATPSVSVSRPLHRYSFWQRLCYRQNPTQAPAQVESPPPQAAATQANSDPVYQELRSGTPGGKAVAVKDVVLKRDAGTFRFRVGHILFSRP